MITAIEQKKIESKIGFVFLCGKWQFTPLTLTIIFRRKKDHNVGYLIKSDLKLNARIRECLHWHCDSNHNFLSM